MELKSQAWRSVAAEICRIMTFSLIFALFTFFTSRFGGGSVALIGVFLGFAGLSWQPLKVFFYEIFKVDPGAIAKDGEFFVASGIKNGLKLSLINPVFVYLIAMCVIIVVLYKYSLELKYCLETTEQAKLLVCSIEREGIPKIVEEAVGAVAQDNKLSAKFIQLGQAIYFTQMIVVLICSFTCSMIINTCIVFYLSREISKKVHKHRFAACVLMIITFFSISWLTNIFLHLIYSNDASPSLFSAALDNTQIKSEALKTYLGPIYSDALFHVIDIYGPYSLIQLLYLSLVSLFACATLRKKEREIARLGRIEYLRTTGLV